MNHPIEIDNAEAQRNAVIGRYLDGNHSLFDLMTTASRNVLGGHGAMDSINPENASEAAISRIEDIVSDMAVTHRIELQENALREIASAILEQSSQAA
jgi:hypothetical protein